MRKQAIVMMTMAGLLCGSVALAQKAKGKPPGKVAPAPAPADGPAMREKVLERLRMMRMWKLTEVLVLDEATGAKLFPLLKQFDDRTAPIVEEMRVVRQELKKAMDKGATMDAATANAQIERLLAARKKMQELENERIAAVRKVLTPVQQARLVLVLPQINQMIQQAVRRAMRAGRGGPGFGGGRGGKGPGGMGGPGMGGPGGGPGGGAGSGDFSGMDDDDIQ